MVLFLVWVYVMHSTYFGRVVVKVETLPDSLVITEVFLLFQYFLFKREDQI
mgnify:CR=1 FL=1